MAFANAATKGTAAISAFTASQPSNANYIDTTPYAPDQNGFDLIYFQAALQGQMATVQNSIDSIQNNANLSDTEKMFSMQMAMNTWSAIANLRTNMLKSVSDTLKTITRNVN